MSGAGRFGFTDKAANFFADAAVGGLLPKLLLHSRNRSFLDRFANYQQYFFFFSLRRQAPR